MELNLKIIGILLILLGIFHVIFPRYFKWKQDFIQVSHINRQMMYVHAFFIALMVFLLGLLCITSANEIISTNLGKKISLGIGIFWTARLLIQFFGYSSLLWKGKTFETTIHILFSVLWIYLSMIFLTIYFIQ
jgi:hypothetical protein